MWQLLHHRSVAQHKELLSVGKMSFLQLALFHQRCSKGHWQHACPVLFGLWNCWISVCLSAMETSLLSSTKARPAYYLFIVYIFSFSVNDSRAKPSPLPALLTQALIKKTTLKRNSRRRRVKMSFQLLCSVNKQVRRLPAICHLFKHGRSRTTLRDLQVVLLHPHHAGRWPIIPLLRLRFSHFVTGNVQEKH